jgi:hypothetical protein
MRDGLQQELRGILRDYLDGEKSLDDCLAWEAGLALDPDVPRELRQMLDRLALVGEEVDRGMREEADFREIAARTLEPAARP